MREADCARCAFYKNSKGIKGTAVQEHFEINDQIHSGRYCNIYRAIRRSDGTPVILKTCHVEHQQRHFEQLQSEYQLSQKLRSRRSVRPIDIHNLSNQLVVVYRDDALSPLGQHIPGTGLQLGRFLRIAQEICKALFELHSQGLAHRNISPDNIVVDDSFDTAKLIDFGQASRFTEHNIEFELPPSLLDSLAYISPEQTGRTNTAVDWRSDIYSLGCCFYYMLTGAPPFNADEAADLIYAHIALDPKPIHLLREDLPKSLSALLNKLLDKEPENRYQNLRLVLDDLKRIEQSQLIGQDIENFKPSSDRNDQPIRLSPLLYGRDQELELLNSLLSRSRHSAHVIEITGAAGIGKTALIRQLFTSIGADKGFFISGKFDQLNRGKAYSAIADALAEFSRQCLQLPAAELDLIRDSIQDAVGSLGKVLLEIAPQMEAIIGQQAELSSASPRENTQRRNLLMQNFFRCICSQGFTIVLFLDDLQWADSASIALMDAMIDAPNKGFMCFLSYRNQEVSDVHPASSFLEKLPKRAIEHHKIELQDLSSQAIRRWLGELLENNQSQLDTLCTQITLRSAGNPFHIQSLLNKLIRDENLYRNELGFIEVDIEQLKKLAVGGIINHLQEQIEQLDEGSKAFLEQLAVLGNRFSIQQINTVNNCALSSYEKTLESLIKAKLLIKVEQNILFVHDRIQQATIEALSKEKLCYYHLKAGRSILAKLQSQNEEIAKAEQFIQHFNAAEPFIKEPDERLLLARLNIQLGEQYKFNAAYQLALDSFEMALKFIPGSPFNTDHHLAIDLYSNLGEVLFLNQQYEKGEEAFAKVSKNSKSPIEKANASIIQFRHFASNQDLPLAVKKVKKSLSELEIELPNDNLEQKAIEEFGNTVNAILEYGIHDMVSLPLCEDHLAIAQQEVLVIGSLPAYLGAPEIFPFMIYHSIDISLTKGMSDHSPLGMMAMAGILFAAEQVEMGIELGEAALNQSTLIDDRGIRTQLYTMYACNIFHFHAPGRDVYEYFDMAAEFAMEASDYDYGSMAASQRPYYAWNFDPNLDGVLQSLPSVHRKLEEFGKDDPIFMNKFLWEFLSTLTDKNSDGISFSGEHIDEKWLHDYLSERKHYTYLGIYTTLKLQAMVIMQQIDEAIAYSPTVKGYIDTMPGAMVVFLYRLCSSLALLQKGLQQGLNEEQYQHVNDSIRLLSNFAPHCPDNFLGKQKLLEAALAAQAAELAEAIPLFEEALETIQQSLIPIDQALGHEFFARYLLSKNVNSYAFVQLELAYNCYEKWGHLSKCSALEREFPKLTKDEHSSHNLNAQLNLDALSSSIELLSEVKEIDTLLTKLLASIQQNSGATSASIILHQNLVTELKAYKSLDNRTVICADNNKSLSQYQFKHEIIKGCLLEEKDYVLESFDNSETAFAEREHSKSLSVLAISLRHQAKIIGLIYLENKHLSNGFNRQHIQFLSLLAGQAAIAIENAQAFTNINKEKDYSASIINNSSNMICGLDGNGKVLFSNPITEHITGFKQQDLVGKNWWQLLFPGDSYEQVDNLFNNMNNGFISNIEMQITHRDGSHRDILWNSFANTDGKGQIEEIIGFATDITMQNEAKRKIMGFNKELTQKVEERTEELRASNEELTLTIDHLKETQEQLIESEKMASLGSLVAGIAHEINTPIGISVTAVTHFRDKTTQVNDDYRNARMSQQQLENYLKEGHNVADLAYKNLKRAADLIASFKQISVDQTSDSVRAFNLQEYMEEMRLSLEIQISYRKITLHIDCPIDREITSYPGDYSQIFTNLLSNSLKHAFKEEEEGKVNIGAKIEEEHIVFEYWDNGCGIPKKNLKRIFDPFFTTGHGSGGTGLGLHILYNIVTQKLSGTIKCQSEEDEWTKFIVRLPLELPQQNAS